MSASSLAYLGWFLIPWQIFGSKVIRVSNYERKHGLFHRFGQFNLRDFAQRKKERLGTDAEYRRMHAAARRWLYIMIGWWGVSFFVALVIAIVRHHR